MILKKLDQNQDLDLWICTLCLICAWLSDFVLEKVQKNCVQDIMTFENDFELLMVVMGPNIWI